MREGEGARATGRATGGATSGAVGDALPGQRFPTGTPSRPVPRPDAPPLGPAPRPRARQTGPRRPTARRVLLTLGAAGIVFPVLGLPAYVLRVADPPPPALPARAIAVLTGGPDRVERGLALLAARDDARLLISGVGHAVVPADLGAVGERITLGRTATSTRGNAREVAAWARAEGFGRGTPIMGDLTEITVVTAGFHMPRALLELRRALPEARFTPHPVPPNLPRSAALLREYAKLLGAALGLSALVDRPRSPTPNAEEPRP